MKKKLTHEYCNKQAILLDTNNTVTIIEVMENLGVSKENKKACNLYRVRDNKGNLFCTEDWNCELIET